MAFTPGINPRSRLRYAQKTLCDLVVPIVKVRPGNHAAVVVSSTVTGGFLRDGGGAITTFSVPGSLWTEPESINDAGDITMTSTEVATITCHSRRAPFRRTIPWARITSISSASARAYRPC
jgi:hypothetical protein